MAGSWTLHPARSVFSLTGTGPVAFRHDGYHSSLRSIRRPDPALGRGEGCLFGRFALPSDEKPKTLALSGDGTKVAAALTSRIVVWNATTSELDS